MPALRPSRGLGPLVALLAGLTACATGGAPAASGPAPTAGGAPKNGDIYDRAIRDHQAVIKACYDGYLNRGSPAGANLRVTVRMVILADGAVESAAIVPAPQYDVMLDTCILTAVRAWLLPKPPTADRITLLYPFNFTGDRRALGSMPDRGSGTAVPDYSWDKK